MKVLLNFSIQQIGRTTGFGVRMRATLYLFKQLNSRLESWSGGWRVALALGTPFCSSQTNSKCRILYKRNFGEVLPSYLEEKEDYRSSDTTENVSLDVRGHFVQDRAPAHTAKKTQTWLSQHIPGYWQKEFGLATHRILIPLKIFGRLFKQSLTRRDQPLTCRAP